MSFSKTSIFLLLQQILYLTVIIPGHQRGAVTLPGFEGDSCCTPSAARACCPDKGKADHAHSPADSAKRMAHCAICFDALRLSFVLPPELAPAPTGLVGQAISLSIPPIPSILLVLPYDSTGPPAAL